MSNQRIEIYDDKKVALAKQIIIDFKSKLTNYNIENEIISSDLSLKRNAINSFFKKNTDPYKNEDCLYFICAIEVYTMCYRDSKIAKYDASFFNITNRDFSEMLATARFFINNCSKLLKFGWDPSVPRRNMARADSILETEKTSNDVLFQNVINLSFENFKKWYQSL